MRTFDELITRREEPQVSDYIITKAAIDQKVLEQAKAAQPSLITKTSIMLGVGERAGEAEDRQRRTNGANQHALVRGARDDEAADEHSIVGAHAGPGRPVYGPTRGVEFVELSESDTVASARSRHLQGVGARAEPDDQGRVCAAKSE